MAPFTPTTSVIPSSPTSANSSVISDTPFFSSVKRMAPSASVSISVVLTKSRRKIGIHFRSSPTFSLSAGKARVYTALDLRHAYYLVRIKEGDE